MSSINWSRALGPFALLSFLAVTQVGCAVEAQTDDEQVDAESDAISSTWSCNVTQLGTDRCQNTVADIRKMVPGDAINKTFRNPSCSDRSRPSRRRASSCGAPARRSPRATPV